MTCITQFVPQIYSSYPTFHRFCGRLMVFCCLITLVGAGGVLYQEYLDGPYAGEV